MNNASTTMVGVGLRHEHYFDALEHIAPIDFVEVHAENFFAAGGASLHLLHQARQHYQLSIHATALGLGSIAPPDPGVVDQLKHLVNSTEPFLVSDHACFNRAEVHGKQIHTGDLLPLRYNGESLDILCRHVDSVQEQLQRTILLENLSAYLPNQENEFAEFEFLAALASRTGCQLLLDVNNILVNAHNERVLGKLDSPVVLDKIMTELAPLSTSMIGEYHLAGTTPKAANEIIIDDHARPVSEECWELYQLVLGQFGIKPTLIEWDQDLPSWQELTALAVKAKDYQQKVLP